MQNNMGNNIILSVEGSSHGEFVGGILKNFPAGITVDYSLIASDIQRRKPQKYGTPRHENDTVEFLSGITDGKTDGTDIKFKVMNTNVRTQDYDKFKLLFRPSHADYPYYAKYGEDNLIYKDMASARMFLPYVIAGCFSKMLLKRKNISVTATVVEIGGLDYINDKESVIQLLNDVSTEKDTVGGLIKCVTHGIKAGIGEPIFGKISSKIAKEIMNIPSAVSFHLGDTLNRHKLKGSEDIDNWSGPVNNTDCPNKDTKQNFTTVTNHCGGINAGITNGMPIVFYAGFHPIHTLGQKMKLINPQGDIYTMEFGGRHDICQVLRTAVIVENVTAMVIADCLMNENDNL